MSIFGCIEDTKEHKSKYEGQKKLFILISHGNYDIVK